MVRLTIDGKVVEAKKGTSILHAAESVGIKIPTLCYIKDLLPDGSCRMCMVEIEMCIRDRATSNESIRLSNSSNNFWFCETKSHIQIPLFVLSYFLKLE